MKDSNSNKLLWVNSSIPDSPFDRSKLRQKVMQKVALRRKTQPKHHHPNSRQLPVFILDDDLIETKASRKHEDISNEAAMVAKDSSSLSQTSLTNMRVFAVIYPSMLLKCNLDFSDLSLLASLEIGRYTGQRLLESPDNLSHFLGGKNWSYCRYVPFHYDHSVLVRNAMDCVLARVRCLLSPKETKWESLALSYYSTALSSLQEAINSTSQLPTAEILCATQILGLYELLNPTREDAWIKHAAGAACIIRLRGPDSYGSEFEKSLFMSHVGPIITESILNNQNCFLEQPAWRAVLRSVITDDPLVPERSTMVNSLLGILISIPGIFRDFTQAICHYSDRPLTNMVGLISRARGARLSLQSWYSSYIGPDDTPINGPVFCDGYYKILILFYICSIYSNRLNTCVYWTGTLDIEEMEDETQRFANNIVSLYKEEAYWNLQSSLLLAQKLPIAEATIKSHDDWKKQLSLGSHRGQLFKMPKQTFENWCSLFGRKIL